jgi:hypothetical protein
MKTIIKLVIFIGAIISSLISFAQSSEEEHVKLNGLHEKVMTNAALIRDAKDEDKEMNSRNADEAGQAVEKAIKEHHELKKYIPDHKKEMAKVYHHVIETQHEQAKMHYEALKAELAKENYSIKLAREHSARLHEAARRAELEHQKLKDKLDD